MRKAHSLYINYAMECISADQFPDREEFILNNERVEEVERDIIEGKVAEGLDRESYYSSNLFGFGNLFRMRE